MVDGAVQGEEAQGGEVGESADEVALAAAEVTRARDAGRVEPARRDVGRVAEVRVRGVVRRLRAAGKESARLDKKEESLEEEKEGRTMTMSR